MIKDFCYFDKKTGDYVQLECNLKEEIGEEELHKFYDKLNTVKSDSTNSTATEFGDDTTVDLRKSFTEMLIDDVISFKEVYNLFENDHQRRNPRLANLMKEFMSMFDYREKLRFTKKEFSTLIRMNDSVMFEESPVFKKEVESTAYNTAMIELNGCEPILKKTEKKLIRK